MSVNTKMTAIADEIRELSGTTDPMGLDAMATNVNEANTEIGNQSGIIEQIGYALFGKTRSSNTVPVRGVDYWTEEDQEHIVQQVVATLGTPVFGTVDSDKNIILSGNLVNSNYTVKYEGVDGEIITIGELVVSQRFVNQIIFAINSDGTEFVGSNGEDGYKTGYRLNSSGVEVEVEGINATGFIKVRPNDVVYIKNMEFKMGEFDNSYYCYLSVYDSYFNLIASGQAEATMAAFVTSTYTIDETTNNLVSVTLDNSVTSEMNNVAYIRMSYIPVDGQEPILTLNQPIE